MSSAMIMNKRDSTAGIPNDENLHILLEEYREVGSSYRHSVVQKTLVDSILANKTNIINVGKMKTQQEISEQSFHKLHETVDQFIAVSSELQNEILASQAMEEIAVSEMAAEIQETYSEKMKRIALQDSISANENMIQRMREELKAAKATLQQKQAQHDALLAQPPIPAFATIPSEEVIVVQEKEIMTVASAPEPVATETVIKNSEFEARMAEFNNSIVEAEALFDGLKTVTHIDSLEVLGADSAVTGVSMQIKVKIDRCVAVLALSASKSLAKVEIISTYGAPIDGEAIFKEASKLPAPQDLRFAVFALRACQDAEAMFSKHVSSLKRVCVVRLSGPLKVTFTLSNGLTANIAVHPCYPEVPAGVYLEQLMGVGGWPAQEITRVQNKFNEAGYSNILDAFALLNSS